MGSQLERIEFANHMRACLNFKTQSNLLGMVNIDKISHQQPVDPLKILATLRVPGTHADVPSG